MIGRLLQSAATTFTQHGTSRPSQPPLESVTEEAHTRDLLFPDPQWRYRHRINGLSIGAAKTQVTPRDAASFDDHGGFDIEYPQDVRIIISQDANPRYQSPQILFDSKELRRIGPTNGSITRESDVPGSPNVATHGKSASGLLSTGLRRGQFPNNAHFSRPQMTPTSPLSPDVTNNKFKSFHNQPYADMFYDNSEAAQVGAAKDEKDDTDDILGCVFGAAGFRLEASTKLHIIPRKLPEPSAADSRSPHALQTISSSELQRRRTALFRSTSAVNLSERESSGSPSENSITYSTKAALMFTRLFSVDLPDSADQCIESFQSPNQFPRAEAREPSTSTVSNSTAPASKVKNVRQKKTPMYAVTVLLQLPEDDNISQPCAQSFQAGPSSLSASQHEPMPASSWRKENSHLFQSSDVRTSLIFNPALEIHLSYVLAHWHVLSRSMELLEVAARCKLYELLEAIPLPPIIYSPAVRKGSGKAKWPKQPIQQSVYVLPGCLQSIEYVQRKVTATARMIINGIKIRRIVTGQNRWGAWKEEARWVGRWAGNRDQNFFFYNVLTAFLGYHTAWLQFLSPARYRRRFATQHELRSRNDNRIEQRTVIVSNDKMAARRLLFLLSAFLPGSLKVAVLQEPSLLYGDRSHLDYSPSSTMSYQTSKRVPPVHFNKALKTARRDQSHSRSVSFSVIEAGKTIAKRSLPANTRRGSDTNSFRTASLAIPNLSRESKKASVSTLAVDSDPPVPHFTSLSNTIPLRIMTDQRVGSGDSLASVALTQNLQRSESISASPAGIGAHWGSVASGFSWSKRRDSATDTSEGLDGPRPGNTDQQFAKSSPIKLKPSKLTHTVDGAEPLAGFHQQAQDDFGSRVAEEGAMATNVSRIKRVERLALKLSFNEEDGFLDVSMSPDQSWTSSLASSLGSFQIHAVANLDSHECIPDHASFMSGSSSRQSRPATEAAGWLKNYHPCFELQAVKPYATLVEEIKRSMLADFKLVSPVDLKADHNPGAWTEVCTTLVASTESFTIERLRLLKRRRPASFQAPSAGGVPPHESLYEEKFVTEPVMDIDSILTDAVERLLTQSGGSSRTHSRAPSPKPPTQSSKDSRSTSQQRKPPPTGPGFHTSMGDASSAECERTVLGALQEVIRIVMEERDGGPYKRNRRHGEPDSTLLQGVRKWLGAVEEVI